MSIVGTNAGVAWAPQVGITSGATNKVADDSATWRWHPANNLPFAPRQMQAPLPQELTGSLLPRGTYKSGVWAEGACEFIPRCSATHLNWLFWALCSSQAVDQVEVSSSPVNAWDYLYGGGTNLTGTYNSAGVFTATTTVGSNRNELDRYLAVKRLLPPDESGNYRGEVILDARVAALSLRAVPTQPLTMTAGFLARRPTWYQSANVMSGGALLSHWDPATRTLGSQIPGLPNNDFFTSCVGDIDIGAKSTADLSAATVEVVIAPNLTTPQQEQVLFDYYPEMFRTTSWNVGVNIIIRKGVYDLYDSIFFNDSATEGADWSPVVWSSGKPFYVHFANANPDYIVSGVSAELGFYARQISWQMEPIAFTPGQLTAVRISGVVEDPGDGKVAWCLRHRAARNPDKDENAASSPGFMTTWPS